MISLAKAQGQPPESKAADEQAAVLTDQHGQQIVVVPMQKQLVPTVPVQPQQQTIIIPQNQYIAVPPSTKKQLFQDDPFFAVGWTTYAIVVGVSVFAGLVRMARMHQKHKKPMTVLEFITKTAIETLIAVFSGILTFWAAMQFIESLTKIIVLVCVAAHLGGKAIDDVTAFYRLVRDAREIKRKASQRQGRQDDL